MKPYHLELINTDARYLVPGVNDPSYADTMNRIIDKEQIDFLHPQPDVEVAFLAHNRDKLKTKTFLPEAKAVDICHDKMAFNQRLRERGVAVPETTHITSQQDLKDALSVLLKIQPKVWLRATR